MEDKKNVKINRFLIFESTKNNLLSVSLKLCPFFPNVCKYLTECNK